MKRIFYILYVAVLLGGCQKHELGPQGGPQADQLAFNTSIEGVPIAPSRAATADTDLKANGFFLAGYHTEGLMEVTAATAIPNVFDKQVEDLQLPVPLVEYKESKFTLKTIKWLLDAKTFLSFFGWSQSKPFATTVSAATTGIIGQTYDKNDTGYPWLEVRNADAPLEQSDVVGTRSIDHPNDAVISAVDLDFRHLLSKLTFRAKSSSAANVTFTGVRINYATGKVCKKARYTFGSDPAAMGSYALDAAETQAGTHPLNATYPAIAAGAQVELGSVLLVPQALEAGDVTLEISYKVSPNGGGIAGPEQTRTLPLAALAAEQGNNYVYSIDIQATDIFILGNPTIEDWGVIPHTALPLVPGPRGDVLLLLDGYDKPYKHTDGKWYWLDRSGWNRHCEIVGYTNTMYSGSGHLYNLTAAQYLQVPALPTVTALSMDVVCQGMRDDEQILFSFIHQGDNHTNDSSRNFFAQFGHMQDKVLYFDTQGVAATGRLKYASSSAEIQSKLMWSFQKQDKGTIAIYANGQSKAKMTDTGVRVLGELVDNRIGSGYQGTISYVKIMRGIVPQSDVEAEYLAQKKRHLLDEVQVLNPYLPPVKNGLLYCYDARSGIKVEGAKQYWEDLAGQNHAEAIGTLTTGTSGFHYNSTDKYFSIPENSTTTYFKQLEAGKAKMPNSYTVELILKSNTTTTSGSPIYWGSIEKANLDNRLLYMHYPGFSGGTIYVDAPAVPTSDRYSFQWPSGLVATGIHKVVIRRQFGSKSEFFISNQLRHTGTANKDIDDIICVAMRLGGDEWGGRYYCFRFYNRALTDSELTDNYNEDKKNITGLN